ncbi:uncharacterized protein FIBRA_01371 [Fibroporia radiculosa]|uniref:SHSP domain-containing protein n=1 Tax=Fibroporia radiculosa TaxID=599839 RepID=J4G0Y3_9APHY|nr:uncharacterized protein FIBRA_01371 [Fibroporia radiculosa]CCL99353.1 predicted protein [Fibroporia radiculosa]
MYEDASGARVIAVLELPGMKQEDISVRIEDGQLIVQGERPFRNMARSSPSPSVSDDGSAVVAPSNALAIPRGYRTQEIKYGMFRRAISLPLSTQAEHVQASLSEGMLTISWPREEIDEPAVELPTELVRSGTPFNTVSFVESG